MKFNLPKDQSSIIKVIGVGGGGSNAVNHMYRQGINGVDFIVCNTDQQALDISPVPHKIQLGLSLTEGRGAGSLPEVGKNAAIENIEEIREILMKNTKMVFITAGMGGGTGTGAAPIIAEVAKELGILTVGIITVPFTFEGRKRRKQADQGIEDIKKQVDTLLMITNDKLREMYGNLAVADAFANADNVLTTAAKGIAEIITRTGYINVDFEDVRTVMTEGGVAIMGSAKASGEERATKAVEIALSSPLLNDNQIKGANYVLLNISFGSKELLMDEISEITDFIQEEAGDSAEIIWGYGFDENLEDEIEVTIIATGFDAGYQEQAVFSPTAKAVKPSQKVYKLEEERDTNLTVPVSKPSFVPSTPAKVEPVEAVKETEEIEKIEESVEDVVEEKVDELEPVLKKQESIEFDWDIKKNIEKEETAEEEVVVKHDLESEEVIEEPTLVVSENEIEADEIDDTTAEERSKRIEERMMKLKKLSIRLRTPTGISDLESEPAYIRRNKKLDSVPPSNESQVSKYTLSETEDEDGNKETKLRSNNSFLHDNVD